jgi:hypothetical protein
MTHTLLPCPFCGYDMEPTEGEMIDHTYGEHGDPSERPADMPYCTYVACTRCEAQGSYANGDAAAIAAWNERPAHASLTAQRDELLAAAVDLRAAQRAYMADRGNETLGKAVGAAAVALDAAIARATQEAGR